MHGGAKLDAEQDDGFELLGEAASKLVEKLRKKRRKVQGLPAQVREDLLKKADKEDRSRFPLSAIRFHDGEPYGALDKAK